MTQPLEAVLLGAGGRGTGFGRFALSDPDKLKIIGVAEPDAGRRAKFAADHSIPAENCFERFEDLLSRPQLAALCVNTTMDHHHLPSALMALKAGYHLFLEKPIAETPQGVLAISEAAQKSGRIIQICHPLRYTPFYTKAREFLDSGAIGRVLHITMAENVAYWHFAHSFVRGNWGVVEKSGPLILTKCCHDMDIAVYLAGGEPVRVASQGGRKWFRAENAPAGAPKRCLDGCPVEKTCPYFAPSMYMTDLTEWPVDVISLDTSLEARRKALETGPYGRCVYHCDNTTSDHQAVTADFDNGVGVMFGVHSTSMHPNRTLRILGSEGELNGHLEKGEISIVRFGPGQGAGIEPVVHDIKAAISDGHLGGDTGAILNFVRMVRENDLEGSAKSLKIAVDGHLLAFAAEKARASASVVAMEEFNKSFKTA